MTNEEQIIIEQLKQEESNITEEDIESTYMSSWKLIQQVDECKANGWVNSDIGASEEAALETIADHFRSCESCRKAFDDQRYEDETIQEFSKMLGGSVYDWICELPSKEVEEVGYYDLVRVTPTHGSSFHIPAPFFLRTQRRIDFVFALPVAEGRRGNDYYSCPHCGEESFFSGPCCGWCQHELDLDLAYRNHEALKRASKKEFLRRLDQGIPDLGISSAEFVISYPFSCYVEEVEVDEGRDEEEVEVDEGEEEEEARRQVWYHTHEELAQQVDCRQVDGVWQHKHEGHDYWHPMARVHWR